MILLTGGTGCLGRALRPLLGSDLWAPTRAELDLERVSEIEPKVLERAPEAIVHLAAWTDVDGCEREPERARRVNWLATKALASAAVKLNALFLYISTDYVFDGVKGEYREHDEPNPVQVYGLTKLWGEREALRVPRSYAIRVSWVFGPGGKSFLSKFHLLAKEGKPVKAIADQSSAPTYAPFLAQELLVFLEEGLPYGLWHLAGSEEASYYQFVREGMRALGLGEPEPILASQVRRPARRPRRSFLISQAYKDFTGREVPGWREGLRHFLESLTS